MRNKLDFLIREKNRILPLNSGKFSDFKFKDKIKNLSDLGFDDDKMNFLIMRLKFSINFSKPENNSSEFAIEIDVIVEYLAHSSKIKKSLRNDCGYVLNMI